MIEFYQNLNYHSYDRLFWQICIYRMTLVI
jgi:hypothetical protein